MSKKALKKEQWSAEEQFLSPADIAKQLSISPWTVYTWVYQGK